jgi:hypothetical protein
MVESPTLDLEVHPLHEFPGNRNLELDPVSCHAAENGRITDK